MIAIITLEEAKEWLRIDYEEDNNLITSLMDTSKAMIKSATGVPDCFQSNENIISDDLNNIDSLYTMAQRIIITDLYNEKETENRALTSLYIQLELEYRRCLRNAQN